MAEQELENLKERIEKMEFGRHVEILKFFVDKNVRTNENKTGNRINLAVLYDKQRDIYEELKALVASIEKQEQSINELEIEKQIISNQFPSLVNDDI